MNSIIFLAPSTQAHFKLSPDMPDWHLYMIRTRNGALYTGIAQNVERRFAEHAAGGKKGAKYLRGRGPLKLVYQEKIGTRSQALKAEAAVKKMSKREKNILVKGGKAKLRG